MRSAYKILIGNSKWKILLRNGSRRSEEKELISKKQEKCVD
jgi:hypothetical protein